MTINLVKEADLAAAEQDAQGSDEDGNKEDGAEVDSSELDSSDDNDSAVDDGEDDDSAADAIADDGVAEDGVEEDGTEEDAVAEAADDTITAVDDKDAVKDVPKAAKKDATKDVKKDVKKDAKKKAAKKAAKKAVSAKAVSATAADDEAVEDKAAASDAEDADDKDDEKEARPSRFSKLRRRPKFSSRWVAAVLVGAAIGAGVFGYMRYDRLENQLKDLRQAQSDRELVAKLAKDYALKSLTYTYEDPDAFFRAVESGVSQSLKDKYVNAMPILKGVMVQAQVTSSGEVLATDAVAQPGNVYQVVVSAAQTTRNLQNPKPRMSLILLQITVNKANGGGWEVSDIGPKSGSHAASADQFGPPAPAPEPPPPPKR